MKLLVKSFLILSALLFTSSILAQAPVPEIPFDSAPDFLKLPMNLYLGEAAGVATNSEGHIFVYTRTGHPMMTTGTQRYFARSSARLFEFDQTGKFVREIAQDLYGFVAAHMVRVDRQDNIWVVDEGSNIVIKFDPEGRVVMTLGRKPEAITIPYARPPAGGYGNPPGSGIPGDNFQRPTDVAFDAAGNIFVSDGYINSRIAKFDKNGKFIKSWGSTGKAPGQMDYPHGLATDSQGNVYLADRRNGRIQVFDNEGNVKTQFTSGGTPYAVCMTQGPQQYLYVANSGGNTEEIVKITLDGKILGKFGTAGKQLKEFGTIHSLDCRTENQVLVGELTNWRVQKVTLRPSRSN